MNQFNITIEAISLLVVGIIIYANIFELKQHTKKRDVFTHLLISNAFVIVVDLVSWMKLNWQNKPWLLWILILITYLAPFYIVGIFSKYIYLHISEKTTVSKKPFRIIIYLNLIAAVASFLLCLTGSLFTIRDGKFYSGQLTTFYYLFYIFSLLFFSFIILFYRKKLGIHDTLAALSFCIFPLVSIVISLTGFGINMAIPFMAINVLIIYILLQSERENKLFYQSNIDELTSLYNRRAYTEEYFKYSNSQIPENFIYASIDINGLKQINDTIGHDAGDELIQGAAECLKQVFGKSGKIFRTGGDEFVVMFLANKEKLNEIEISLAKTTDKWKGRLVDSLAMSIGYASKKEFASETINELSKISDKRMYEAKRKFYAAKGVDRRGQAAAHAALCNLYTKILKINLTNDTYSIINMDISEQTDAKGFSNTISEWLTGFGKSGQVYNDDLEEYYKKTDLNYLKEYFSTGKTSISIFYRRKFPDGFKNVAMEMIPADDYTKENQTLFLYVKVIG